MTQDRASRWPTWSPSGPRPAASTSSQPILTLAVELDGRVIGDVLIHLDGLDGADGRQAEIGWVFAPDVAGQGYATEAARAITDGRVPTRSGCTACGPSSSRPTPRPSRICERLGMRREALFDRASWFKEQWTDLAIYAIRADEWRAARAD